MSGGVLILHLPDGPGEIRSQRLTEGRIVDVTEGVAGDRVVAIAPAEAVALRRAEIGVLAPAQARGAARLIAAEHSLTPAEQLHVALGAAADGQCRMIGAVAAGRMAAWMTALAEAGHDPDAIIPAPLLLPQPEQGFVRGDIGGREVVRGVDSGFADEPGLADVLIGEQAVAVVRGESLIAAMQAACDAPPLDLRQGRFARKRHWRPDGAVLRRLGLILLALLAVTLLILLTQIVRTNLAADALEQRADALARTGLPRGVPAPDPQRQLDIRLAGLRGGGLGFSAMAGSVFAAVQAVPNVELGSVDFAPDGVLRVTVLAPGAPEAEALRARIVQSGLDVEASPFQSEAGRIRGEFRVSAR